MSCDRLIVLKFGGSVLLSEDRLRIAVHEIYRWRRDGWNVIAVVSALAGTTDALLEKCARISPRSSALAEASVVANGELQAAALLGLQLDRAGIPAAVLLPAAINLIAEGEPLNASPINVSSETIHAALKQDGIAVVPGYVAIDSRGRTVVLGRGGSDLTALFLAHALRAERCRLVKDVDGLYEFDPATSGVRPDRLSHATWDDALQTDGTIVQHKAVTFAQQHDLEFELGCFNGVQPTIIGHGPTEMDCIVRRSSPLRVALLGFGTVGRGVYELIRQLPDVFDVTGIAVRNVERHVHVQHAMHLLATDPVALAGSGADIVIETMGGLEPARMAIDEALRAGSHVVTANKALLADRGHDLSRLAQLLGCTLKGSAAVGGSVPLLERAQSAAHVPVCRIRAILNGTCNFVLDCCSEGMPFDSAVARAQELGFAEADPMRDLSGIDAADKLRIIAAMLGYDLSHDNIQCRPLSAESLRQLRPESGTIIRQVSEIICDGARASASVRPVRMAAHDPLADIGGEHNAAIIEDEAGRRTLLRGRGAGRWPTAEAVIADALKIARDVNDRFRSRFGAPAAPDEVNSHVHDHVSSCRPPGRGASARHAEAMPVLSCGPDTR